MRIFNWHKPTPDKQKLYYQSLRDIARDLSAVKTSLDTLKTAVDELMDDHATFKTAVDESKTAIDELIDDHATFKAVVDELKDWAQTLATKLNNDAGVSDTDYDTTITNSAPDTLTAGKPSAAPATLSASKPTAMPNLKTVEG